MNNNTIPVSACIIAYKEGMQMYSLIENIAPFVAEVVLIYDGHEADDTIEKAQKACAQYDLPLVVELADRKGHCEAHRARSFALATHDWILKIDADERLEGDLTSLRNYIAQHPQVSRIRLLWGDKEELLNAHYKRRKAILFDKTRNSYIWVRAKKPILQTGKSVDLDMVQVLHLDVRRSFGILIKKAKKWSKKHAQAMLLPLEDIEQHNVTSEEKEAYKQWQQHLIKTAPIRIIPAALAAMWLKYKDGKRLKAVLQGGVHTGLFYWHLWRLSSKK